MNILIVKLSALGDVVHTLPSLAALRTLYPEAHISWVIEEAASDLIQDHPLLDRVLLSRRKRWQAHPWAPETRREVRSFFMALRDRPYDLVIDFHGLFKSAILAYLSGGKRRLGYASLQELSGLFYTERIPEDMDKHAVDRYLDFIRYLGMEDPPVTFPIPAPPGVKERAQTLLMQVGITGDFIAINPVALWPTKLWSEEQFASLADQIMGELSIPVLLREGKMMSHTSRGSLPRFPITGLIWRGALPTRTCRNLPPGPPRHHHRFWPHAHRRRCGNQDHCSLRPHGSTSYGTLRWRAQSNSVEPRL